MSRPPLAVIAWPYHGGIADVSMGLGGSALAGDASFLAGIAAAGWEPQVAAVEPVDETLSEIARIFELDRRLARSVAEARGRGAFPLVLGGNCVSCLGTTAGAPARRLGAVWLDAHADFDTPEDNLSGFTDVMGLAILTGGCWRALRETIPGFAAGRRAATSRSSGRATSSRTSASGSPARELLVAPGARSPPA